MSIEALEGISDEDLFKDANSDEAPAEEPVVEDPEAAVEQAAEVAAEKPAAEGTDAPVTTEKPAVDDNAPQVPSWRVREINDEKRTLADKVAALEAEKLQWHRQPTPQPQPVQEKAAKPDPLLDPDGYAKAVRDEVREEMLADRRETSLANAHKTYKGEFEEAYAAAQKQIDPVLKARMQQSRDPGETLMEWHREVKTRAEVGTDPNAYFNKRFEAYLSDPANQAKVLERIRGGVQPSTQPGAKPPAVSLPPSLTRTAAAATITADDDDISDDGLWRHANA